MILSLALTWRITAIAAGAAFIAGAAIGVEGTRRWIRHDHLTAQLASKSKELQRYQQALGFSAELEDETIRLEVTNEDIAQAIIRTARTLPDNDRVCVSADSMCGLSTLKLYTPPSAVKRSQCGEDHRIALEKEHETTELIVRLRQSELKNARAVLDCQAFYAKLRKLHSGK